MSLNFFTKLSLPVLALTLFTSAVKAAPVINEIHYNNDVNTVLNEFVEIYNPDATAIDLSGWKLNGAVEFTFPLGSTLASGGYMVVAEDPDTILSEYGVIAVGTYTGGLNSEGESLELIDSSSNEIDVVDYGVGFPWPSLAAGEGSSIELVNPLIDNNLGSSWRSSSNSPGVSPYSQSAPSPGAQNGAYSGTPAPNVESVSHFPISPSSTDDVVVTAIIPYPLDVTSVTIAYGVVEPGSYVRKTSSQFENGWDYQLMSDALGNGTYTFTIPAGEHRDLMRYRIIVQGTNSVSNYAPMLDDTQSNFAYFVYDGTPSWSGADEPGADAEQTFSPTILDELPAYHLIADATDVQNSQFNSSFNNTSFYGTLVYDGVVYDHITFEIGGTGSTYLSGKNKWRIKFNPTRDLRVRDNYGNLYEKGWDKLTMNACASPRAVINRGLGGIDEAISFRTHQLAGSLSPNTSFLHFRVIDDAEEASPTDQYTGDLWGLYLAVEEVDGDLLDTRELTAGNLYRSEDDSLEYQAKQHPDDGSDWSTFASQSSSTNTETWWRENFDLEKYYSFRVSNRALGNVDLRSSGNHYFYHGTSDDGTQSRWAPIPWDMDMMFISVSHQSGVITQEKCLNHSAIAIEYRNRSREVLDLLLDDSTADGGQVGQLIDEYAQIINPVNQPLTWADLDRYMWNFNPLTETSNSPKFDHQGNFNTTPLTESRIGGTWTRTLDTPDFEGSQKYLLDYMTDVDPNPSTWSEDSGDQRGYGYNFVSSEAADADIPDTPIISYTGDSGFPTNQLSFVSSAFSDPQGVSTSASIQWRIGEISSTLGEPRVYEIEDNWTSDELTSFDLDIAPPATAVIPGQTYRARVRHLDTSGRWSHWSEPVQFVAGLPDVTDLQQNLIISEIMYNPSTDQAHEYIELCNSGSSAIDLTNLSFTDGIDFDFPAGTLIQPGDYILVVKDIAAFELLYGSGLPIAGSYGTTSLSNGGENISLSVGSVIIHDFEYDDKSPWPTDPDGGGYALVLTQTSDNSASDPLDPLGHGIASNWRQSFISGGTPGVAELGSTFTGDPDADNDFDGISALLEYALGSSDSSYGFADVTVDHDGTHLYISFSRNPLATDIEYIIETSPDLVTWTVGAELVSQTENRATYKYDVSGESKYFIRLRVESTVVLQQ